MAPRMKKSPTSPTAKQIDAEPKMKTPEGGSKASLLPSGAVRHPAPHEAGLGPAVPADLDFYQAGQVALLASRLGGRYEEIVAFLVTTGLFALGLDGAAYARIHDGIERIFGEDAGGKISSGLAEHECEAGNVAREAFSRLTRPLMFGNWRGEPVAERPEM